MRPYKVRKLEPRQHWESGLAFASQASVPDATEELSDGIFQASLERLIAEGIKSEIKRD
jgi:hypothetical protein